MPFILSAFIFFVSADSYSGPYCYENPKDFSSDKNSLDEDPDNIRGTCKKIELRKFYELDPSLREEYFFFVFRESLEPSMELNSTTSPTIEDQGLNGKYGYSSYYVGHRTDGDYCYELLEKNFDKGNIRDVEDLNYTVIQKQVFSCLEENAQRLGDIFNFDKIVSAGAQPYQDDQTDNLVAVTSPLKGYNEYWIIKKAPSGKIYRENIKSEEVLDNGSVKILNKAAATSTETNTQIQKNGFFSRLLSFFRNLF